MTNSASGTIDWRHYIVVNGQRVAIVSRKSSGTNAVNYVLEDNQGSSSVLTSSTGTNLVRVSYNPFGLQRDGADWDGAVPSGDLTTLEGITRRGYTGHSMLGRMGLIHMNGRVQDAITGRFLSPDPTIPDAGFTQSYNRYAYVNNNPMSYTDPSGFTPRDVSGTGGMSQEQFMRRYQAMAEMYSAFCGGNTESPECWNAGQEWGFYQSTYQNMMVEIQSLRFAEQVVGWSNSCTGQCGIPGTQGYVTCYLAGCDSTHAGARSTFEIGKKTFVVVGGTDSERARAEADMRLIVSTPRGSKMLTELESQRTFFFFKSSFTIDLTAVNNAFVRIGERDAVHIDPTFNPIIQTTIGPIPANSTRVLGHELGHAAFGTKDDGPNKMNNVNQNENVIMNALGQPSRTVY